MIRYLLLLLLTVPLMARGQTQGSGQLTYWFDNDQLSAGKTESANGCSLHVEADVGHLCTLEGGIAHGTSSRFHGLLHSGGRYAVSDTLSAKECIEENTILSKARKEWRVVRADNTKTIIEDVETKRPSR